MIHQFDFQESALLLISGFVLNEMFQWNTFVIAFSTYSAQSSLSIFAQKYLHTYEDTYFILQNKYLCIYKDSFGVNKVWSEKKFTHICMYYTNSARVCVKSLRSAKSRHSKDSKLVRQVHIIEKILSETMSEQKIFFCENAIFVKNYWHKKVHFDMWVPCKIC